MLKFLQRSLREILCFGLFADVHIIIIDVKPGAAIGVIVLLG